MNRITLTALFSAAATLVFAPKALSQCQAPAAWFPHAKTPAPDHNQLPAGPCDFHRWAWQSFLWLTQPTTTSKIRLFDLPTLEDLFMPGKGPVALNLLANKKKRLILMPRVAKTGVPSGFGDIRQAGSKGVLVDKKGRAVYYAVHVSPKFYEFVRDHKLHTLDGYQKALPTLNFPNGAMELKSSWRIVAPGENVKGIFTTKALVHPLVCKNGAKTCKGEDVVIDLAKVAEETVALVGLHVVGVVEGHPEFIWATFEHDANAPDLDPNVDPVSNKDWAFHKAGTLRKDCNQNNKSVLEVDVATQMLKPITNVCRNNPFGSGVTGDTALVKALNASVHAQLDNTDPGSVWLSYFLVGSVWFGPGQKLEPGLAGAKIQKRTTGSVMLANATMETFDQTSHRNCFSCHDTGATDGFPKPKNINLSRILLNALKQRSDLHAANAKFVRFLVAPPNRPLTSFQDVKNLLNDFVNSNGVPIQMAPHGVFWNKLTYKEFTEGDTPNAPDPATGNPLKILVKRKSKESNLILSLRGEGPLFNPVDGSIGRMPISGPFLPDAQINLIAKWIDDGCPNVAPMKVQVIGRTDPKLVPRHFWEDIEGNRSPKEAPIGKPDNRLAIKVKNGDVVRFSVNSSAAHGVIFERAKTELEKKVWEVSGASGVLSNLPKDYKNFDLAEARRSEKKMGKDVTVIEIKILNLTTGESILFGCDPHSVGPVGEGQMMLGAIVLDDAKKKQKEKQ